MAVVQEVAVGRLLQAQPQVHQAAHHHLDLCKATRAQVRASGRGGVGGRGGARLGALRCPRAELGLLLRDKDKPQPRGQSRREVCEVSSLPSKCTEK